MLKLLAVLFGATIGVTANQTPTPGDIRDRLESYLAAYEPALSALVAREQMTQTIETALSVVEHRKLESEVSFMQLPGDSGWMGNLPNLPLELLHCRHREQFSYAIEGRDTINRVPVSRYSDFRRFETSARIVPQ